MMNFKFICSILGSCKTSEYKYKYMLRTTLIFSKYLDFFTIKKGADPRVMHRLTRLAPSPSQYELYSLRILKSRKRMHYMWFSLATNNIRDGEQKMFAFKLYHNVSCSNHVWQKM